MFVETPYLPSLRKPVVVVMPGLVLSDDVVRMVAIALPVLVLLTLVVILVTRSKRKKRRQTLQAFDTSRSTATAEPATPFESDIKAEGNESAISRLQAQIDHVQTAGPKSALAQLYFDLAELHHEASNEPARLAALRSTAGLAAQHGPRTLHALARLELAEAAYALGDLTGACEQWQIARGALHDDGQRDAYAAVDKRMRDHGCPTDWVLTDF